MSALKYWDGSQWRNVAGGPAFPTIVPVTNVTLATPGNGSVAYTTLDVSAYVPADAKIAVLNCIIGGTRVAATFASNTFSFRKDAASPVSGHFGCSVAGTGAAPAGVQTMGQVFVPLTAARTFQYDKTDSLVASSGGSITLVGYVI